MADVRFTEFAEFLSTVDPEQREAMLARAALVAANATSDEKFDPPIQTFGDYIAMDIPVPPVLVEPALVVRGGLNVLVARAGVGKTQLNLNRFMKWSCGRPLFDDVRTPDGREIMAPSHPLRILLVENEGSGGMFQRQVKKMRDAGGDSGKYLTEEDRKLVDQNLLVWGDGGYSGVQLDDPEKLDFLRAGIEKWKPDIVFLDPLRSLWNGEENSSTDMSQVMNAIAQMASDYDCAVIVPHHAKKGNGDDPEAMSKARGSTVLEGAVATMENWDKAKGGDFREWTVSKHRYSDGAVILPIRMEWQSEDQWYTYVPLDAIEQAVLDVLAENPDDPMTLKDLEAETDESSTRLSKVLKQLAEGGKVKKMPSIHTGNGSSGIRYRLSMANGDSEGGGELDF